MAAREVFKKSRRERWLDFRSCFMFVSCEPAKRVF
jgi:hypothetical protein